MIMSEERMIRQYDAIIAHQGRERVMVVKLVSYDHWRLPYGDHFETEFPIETARRILGDAAGLHDEDIRYAQATGDVERIGFSREDKETWDMSATANLYLERDLRFYVADLAEKVSTIRKGHRIDAVNMVRPERLNEFLVGDELRIVEDICLDIVAGRL